MPVLLNYNSFIRKRSNARTGLSLIRKIIKYSFSIVMLPQVIDKKITTTDTGIHFKKLKSIKLSLVDYNRFLEDLAKAKKVELDDIKSKMANCGAPGVHNATVGSITI